MSNVMLSEAVHTATIHRDDAPIGQSAQFHLRKRFADFPCCYRSWSRQGKHVYLHGYELSFDIEFACAETEPDSEAVLNNRVLKDVRTELRRQFDHTTLVAADDPHLELFELLAERGVIDLRIMISTGMQASAAWVFDTVDSIVFQATAGRVWVSRVIARESRNNVITLTAEPPV
ncbi:6-carboxytetrahydropterin synthase [Mycobacterium bourgelatii]|uniref:6-carboxy-5,6,7,8-tetrahydropterin synthase n=1 Tax=Mycobacterium bourgelatii TaxID=1273442 RepID=A0A7I9YY55_MYCBU|nr:6-carboxytetrahydropterin synthase [Mycobacterium bourgelatii]MCV6974865.1 6-carboxytetrahydropterin synthase [Mycobacterium bourgelatii]GFG93533.1 hypothetical protein MBOU_55750 [Mycobacterium bourgelatii]